MTLAQAKKILEPLPKETKIKLAIFIEYLTKKGKKSRVTHSDTKRYFRHFGIIGMHWGIRRYQNEDGTLTPAGKERYGDENTKTNKPEDKKWDDDGFLSYETRKKYNEDITKLTKEDFENQLLAGKKEVQKMLIKLNSQGFDIKEASRNTDEYEEMKLLEKEIKSMEKEWMHYHEDVFGDIYVSDRLSDTYTEYSESRGRYVEKARSLTNEYGKTLLSKMMDDLGYFNNEEAAEYVMKNKWIEFLIDEKDLDY